MTFRNGPANVVREGEDTSPTNPFNKIFARACAGGTMTDAALESFYEHLEAGTLTYRHLYRLFSVPAHSSPWREMKKHAGEFLLGDSRFMSFLTHISQREGWESGAWSFHDQLEGKTWFSHLVLKKNDQALSTPQMFSGKSKKESRYHATLDFMTHYFSETLVSANQTKVPDVEKTQTQTRGDVLDSMAEVVDE